MPKMKVLQCTHTKKFLLYLSTRFVYNFVFFILSQRVCGSFHHSIYALQMYAMILEAFVIFKGHQSTNTLRSVEGFLIHFEIVEFHLN